MKLLTHCVALLVVSPVIADDVKSVADYKAEAMAVVQPIGVAEAALRLENEDVVFVDVREGDELLEHGKIPGSTHLPRGVLEFYIDPSSGMHMSIFSSDRTVIFYCETGGRSLLAAKLAIDMGVSDALFLEGGYSAWAKSGATTDDN